MADDYMSAEYLRKLEAEKARITKEESDKWEKWATQMVEKEKMKYEEIIAKKDIEIIDLHMEMATNQFVEAMQIAKKEPVGAPAPPYECVKCQEKIDGLYEYRKHVINCVKPYK